MLAVSVRSGLEGSVSLEEIIVTIAIAAAIRLMIRRMSIPPISPPEDRSGGLSWGGLLNFPDKSGAESLLCRSYTF